MTNYGIAHPDELYNCAYCSFGLWCTLVQPQESNNMRCTFTEYAQRCNDKPFKCLNFLLTSSPSQHWGAAPWQMCRFAVPQRLNNTHKAQNQEKVVETHQAHSIHDVFIHHHHTWTVSLETADREEGFGRDTLPGQPLPYPSAPPPSAPFPWDPGSPSYSAMQQNPYNTQAPSFRPTQQRPQRSLANGQTDRSGMQGIAAQMQGYYSQQGNAQLAGSPRAGVQPLASQLQASFW